jgi:hypothetical protein
MMERICLGLHGAVGTSAIENGGVELLGIFILDEAVLPSM